MAAKRHAWPGLKAVAMIEIQREINGKIETETRFYITSLVMEAVLLEAWRYAVTGRLRTVCIGLWT